MKNEKSPLLNGIIADTAVGGRRIVWIKRDDAKPSENTFVWLTIQIDPGEEFEVVQGYLDYNKGWRVSADINIFRVVAWTPIVKPEPYEEI